MPELHLNRVQDIESPSAKYNASWDNVSLPNGSAAMLLNKKLSGTGLKAVVNGEKIDVCLGDSTIGTVRNVGNGVFAFTAVDGVSTDNMPLDELASTIDKEFSSMFVYEAELGKIHSRALRQAIVEGLIATRRK